MNLIVFGASGGTGNAFVRQAIAAGHHVTAFVRTPSNLETSHKSLFVELGDAMQAADVKLAVRPEFDAVISCLGANGLGKTTDLSTMTANILDAMSIHDVKRIIYMASAGINKEIPGVTGFIAGKLLQNVLADHRRATDLLAASDTDWTVARPMGLTNDGRTGDYRKTTSGVPKGGRRISREDVADFMLKVATDHLYIRQSVGLAN
ncbi:NAD(P)-dependent oxidoreductase [Pseudalkalibacillus hwajinpoensis]|uniref:SDR family oxidoreductase n=1 Tax=Guptibacillus hwajinpoensis TaxID=208199 RepID=A0A4U1MBN5_9BACL|nr:SDR family oxidoreductase [Pseudalkalibacillus hwajinpoensis]TKD67712.1 SDR family oxidoreductase [Pseudalkalibacillus hwajinpoensis]